MKKLEQSLKSIGLSEVESRIYLTLLEYGTLGISELAKMAGIHRTEAYRVLPHLHELHLVTKSLKGKRHSYSAESPNRIEDLFLSFSQNFQKVMPELHSLYKKTEDRPKFSYFQGRTAIREANADVISHLPKNGCYYRLSSGRHSKDHRMFYKENYVSERDRKGLERLIITSEKNRSSDPRDPNRSVMAIPDGFDHFDDHISKVIYDDRVTIIDYLSETGFTIESARYARYEEKVFRLLFQLLKKEDRD